MRLLFPLSVYIAALESVGLQMVANVKRVGTPLERARSNARFTDLSDDDLIACSRFIQGAKRVQ